MTLAAVAQPDNCPTCGQALKQALGLRIDAAARVLISGDRAICLTKHEQGVLGLLLKRFGHCVEPDDLITAAYDLDEPANGRKSVHGFIFGLRLKLAGTGLEIVTHKSFGYALVHSRPKVTPT